MATNEAETFEQLHLTYGVMCVLSGLIGAAFFARKTVVEPKSILSAALIAIGTFLGVIYFAFWITGKFGSLDDVLLEAVSAITTTNLSLVNNPQELGQGLLFLRAATQWVGGLGAICFFSILLPVFTRGRENANNPLKAVLSIYFAVTAILIVAFVLAKMSWFDAITHSFTTISTGGFSNYTNGLSHFNSASVEWIAVAGMFVGGIRPVLLWWGLRRSPVVLWRSLEMRIYVLVVLSVSLILFLSDGDGLRRSFFSVTSAISGTGFFLENWAGFGFGLQILVLVLIATGTMSGTAAGGFGLTRATESVQYIYRELYTQLHPKAVFKVKMGSDVLNESGLSQTQSFQFFYLGALIVGTFALAQSGADLVSAIGGTITAFASMGPSIGEFFSDSASLAELPRPARAVLSVMMLVGRVSIFPIMILLFAFVERLSFFRFSKVRSRMQFLNKLGAKKLFNKKSQDDNSVPTTISQFENETTTKTTKNNISKEIKG